MLLVIDTDVVIAALRSRTGASAELIRQILQGRVRIALSVAMVLEYEAVATRAEQLAASGLTGDEALVVIDALASVAQQVENHFRWRPQLRDAGDEIILESAVNAGADAIVTFNKRDFAGAVKSFGLELYAPREILEILRSLP
ncbi:MAG: putative toxin-antitoxin system toxin component, PIN family [Sphingorhabdus sp.]